MHARIENMVLLSKIRLVFLLTLVYSTISRTNGERTTSTTCQILYDGITDCSGRGLYSVPRDIPSNTRILRLDHNSLTSIESDEFSVLLPNLEELVLNDNLISRIDTSTFCHKLPKLRILRLSRNKLRTIPDLRPCRLLEEIQCSANEISDLNGGFLTGLTNLQKLNLTRNSLTQLTPVMLPQNTSLKQLILNNNQISFIQNGTFAAVPSLEKLRLSKNELSKIAKHVFQGLNNLDALDLSRNKLTTVEHSYFAELMSVKSINLERNRLINMSDGSFYSCGLLTSLNLDYNFLTILTGGPFFGLDNLIELSLRKNNVSVIVKDTWAQTRSMKKLDLSQNNLQVLKDDHFAKAFVLTELNISQNHIHHIEEGAFDDLRNLQIMDLSGNNLSDSMQSGSVFQFLTKLVSLNLNGNKIQTISARLLLGLDALIHLMLGDNPVTTVESYAFSTANNLTRIEISSTKVVCDCSISWLPSWLKRRQMESAVDAVCAVPRSLQGLSIFEVNSLDFKCNETERSLKPLITRQIRSHSVRRGTNETLTCIAITYSHSSVTVEWKKDSKIIPASSRLITTESNAADGYATMYTTYLSLAYITEDMQGSYQCGFKNDYGSAYSESAYLTVLVFPTFTNTPSDVVVKTGQDIKLLCEATGLPTPLLSWYKDGGKNFPAAREGRFHVSPDNMREFIIKNAQWQDRGVYHCNATNIAGSIISNASVDVMFAPMILGTISCTHTKAGAYLLKCDVDSNPKAPVSWYNDGELVQNGSTSVLIQNSTSSILIVMAPKDGSEYVCSASNTLGKVTQKCKISIEDTTTKVLDTVGMVKKSTELDQSTITGLIIIAVVCCVVGTSLVWVVIIYKTRKRHSRQTSAASDEANVPLNKQARVTGSAFKMGDCVSDGSKSDSFLEYRSSRESPSTIYRTASRYQTVDYDMAAAMEPLNTAVESQDSIPYGHNYLFNTIQNNGRNVAVTDLHMSGKAHPFSTFQPSRHHKINNSRKPNSSISTDYIPYIEKRDPPDLALVLHQLKAPSQPPQAVVMPVYNSSTHCEEPAYMNLPRSAVAPKLYNSCAGEEPSEYMNLEPKDIHIYQNTSILKMSPTSTAVSHMDLSQLTRDTIHRSDSDGVDSSNRDTSCSTSNSMISSDCCGADSIGPPNNSNSASLNTSQSFVKPTSNVSDCKSLSDNKSSVGNYKNRREGMADSSFVEQKYGLFTEEFMHPKCSNETQSSDISHISHSTRSDA